MFLLWRYVGVQFLLVLLIALFCSVSIFVVIDFVENTQVWFATPWEEVVRYYALYLPHILYLILPVALLLASVFSVGTLAKHLELVAMRSSGISLYLALTPLTLGAVTITAAMFLFGNTVLPDANFKRFQIHEPKSPENEGGDPHEKYKFVFIGPNRNTYFFQHYSGVNKRGEGVTILVERKGSLFKRYDGRSMHWDNHWVLLDGTLRVFEGGTIRAVPFKRMDLHQLPDTPDDLVNTRNFPDEMRLKDLEKRIEILRRAGEDSKRYQTQWHFKISGCFVNLVMVLLGVSLAAGTGKAGIARKFGIALLLAFGYFVFLRFGLILGENGGLGPAAGAWLGNAVFGTFSLLAFARVGRL